LFTFKVQHFMKTARDQFRSLILIAGCCLFFLNGAHCQEWTRNIAPGSTFFEVKAAFDAYYTNHGPFAGGRETEENSEYNRFKRWEAFVRPRLDAQGHFPASALSREWFRNKQTKRSPSGPANWTLIGPTTVPLGGGGMGRLDVIRFQPGNPNILWVGSASGGLWKSVNGGNTWMNWNTDQLPSMGIADIAIDPHQTNTMYLATGDGYGYEAGGYFWGGTYTAGILKSTDGGLTWDTTGFKAIQSDKNIVQRLLINPSHPSTLLAAARNGLWRSADAGATWTLVLNNHIYDMEFNTSNDSVVYCSGNGSVYKSPDTGISWTALDTSIHSTPGGRISIAVTNANPNYIYALTDSTLLYRSADGGATFVKMTSPGNLINFYGYYDCVLSVSPRNPNMVCVAGMEIGESTDGGASWVMEGNWAGFPAANYVHADNHDIEFFPGSDSTFFSVNDGGLFKTTDGGNTWADLSAGLSISQIYRVAIAASDPGLMYLGLQDNSVIQDNANSWNVMVGGDGMECVVDYSNSNNVIVSTQNGSMSLSTDGGVTFNTLNPGGGITPPASWTIPIIQHPTQPNIFWAGYDEVYQSSDGGVSWQTISTGLLTPGSTLQVLGVAGSDPLRIYAGCYNEMHTTPDGGLSWTDISNGLPLLNNVVTSLAVSSRDPKRCWVTLSGYETGHKVYQTNDAGLTWINFSGTLPNIPADAITYEIGSPDRLYLGTDFGVYTRDSSQSDWQYFNTGLPNVIVDDLEINYQSGKMRAATYGRGLWETVLPELVSVQELPKPIALTVYPNPTQGSIVIAGSLAGVSKITLVNALGQELIVSRPEEMIWKDNACRFDISAFPNGFYFLKIESANSSYVTKVILSR
jgi:photosystem II stability/assembly factor-like uncharacterized protein